LEGVGASREIPVQFHRFFRGLGDEIRTLRKARKLSQEDMISYGFSVRHWQMMEAGRPITLITLLRVAEAFEIPVEKLVASVSHHLRQGKKS
jgi:transcriptional regulator with XRE-family HTH domain